MNRYAQQLQMSKSKASNRLVRLILFKLVKDANKNFCYRCGRIIEVSKDLNLDHKVDWIDSLNPIETFWNLDNVAFSHDWCNKAAGRKPTKFNKGENRHTRNKEYALEKGEHLSIETEFKPKFNAEQIMAMKLLLQFGAKQNWIAEKFNIAESTISRIKQEQAYKNI